MRRTLPSRRRTETHKLSINGRSVFISLGYYNDGNIGEVFIDTAKAGTEMKELMSAVGKLASLSLQMGASPSVVAGILDDSATGTIPRAVSKLILEEMVHPSFRPMEPVPQEGH